MNRISMGEAMTPADIQAAFAMVREALTCACCTCTQDATADVLGDSDSHRDGNPHCDATDPLRALGRIEKALADARGEALEEAAKACDKTAYAYAIMGQPTHGIQSCAHDIRALAREGR